MKHDNKIVSVRFSLHDADLMNKIARDRGQDVSDFIRLSVKKEFARLSYLSDDEIKSLEIKRSQ